jgi:hypothetical protein
LAKARAWLATTAILNRFDPWDSNAARTLDREFVDCWGDVKSPWDQLVGQIDLGSRELIAHVQQRIDEHRARSDIRARDGSCVLSRSSKSPKRYSI